VSSRSAKIQFVVLSCITVGFIARFTMMLRGHNFDFDSYQIVVAAKHDGLTPWQTNRYNYGPIWAHLLSVFDWMNSKTGLGFRIQIVGLLSLADLFIAYFIYKVKGLLLGILFFMNPISIVITGFHNQFDNLAIAIACGAVLWLQKNQSNEIRLSDFCFVFLLGLSLATKHIFIFFVLWIAIRQTMMLKKVLFLICPFLVFGVSMLPYLGSSWEAIERNVLRYESFNNGPFWQLLGISNDRLYKVLFAVTICSIGYFLRNQSSHKLLFLYCITLVVISPAIANQYLAIAAVGALGLFNFGFFPYFLYGAFFLTVSTHGLSVHRESGVEQGFPFGRFFYYEPGLISFSRFGYQVFPLLLIVGLLFGLRRRRSTELAYRH